MAFVYLINRLGTNEYKIGITKGSINKRIKQLQTASGSELFLCRKFETNTPTKLEKILHNKYFYCRCEANNEWFILTDEEALNFEKICKKIQDNIDYCSQNNYFFK